ncbi:hypothetical protein RHMOL_Rhmol06G0039200 [Rhododendron molle]|uniref:Uncharacterized protein n=1 Tax=Rhododendron molle TaxID=49168 RepID=A0ACC0N9T0_RHOML|nr:hypothetical protein RHMOL_Rhmol06G0039200 [Rhododendron molle]
MVLSFMGRRDIHPTTQQSCFQWDWELLPLLAQMCLVSENWVVSVESGVMSRTDTTLNHVYRTTNQCADHLIHIGAERMDHLAHMGAEQEKDLIIAVDIPIYLREFLIRDSLNVRRVLD